jgi:cell wall-associated NlpC family hydrolase
MKKISFALLYFFLMSCGDPAIKTPPAIPAQPKSVDSVRDSIRNAVIKAKAAVKDTSPIQVTTQTTAPVGVNTGKTTPEELVQFAETLKGIPYVWASTDPNVGFDCSGFITYVFTHFQIQVPRSSIDFVNIGSTVPVVNAKKGDLILFTGTNPMETTIGHMGLVVSNGPEGLSFIHSTSGKAMSVTISPLNEQYQKRFIRISRIFPQNN